MPVKQDCPRCGTTFMGSDAIGGLCDQCDLRKAICLSCGQYFFNLHSMDLFCSDKCEEVFNKLLENTK
jgi:hypothetical protein